jgi:prepilin-type N-terminal cleavage/methylation domain-containing protein/prepilin-type processing-associated H-X9-DG protein
MRSRAAGFTIVELLVVIAIIGTLAGLLLPAVQAARESGRRASCKNNVSQVAKAMIQFETQMGAFPSGGWGNLWLPSPNRGGELKQTGGWAFGILPFLEQQPLRDLIERQTATAGYVAAIASPVGVFTCPSRRSASPVATRSPSSGSPSPGSFAWANAATRDALAPGFVAARTDYAANGGKGAACPPLYVLRGVGGTAITQKPKFCTAASGSRTEVTDKDVTTILIGNTYDLSNDNLGGCTDCPTRKVVDDSDNPGTVSDGNTKSSTPLGSKLVTGGNYYPDFQDGIVHRMSRIVPAKITDGMSNTYMLAEKYLPKEGYGGAEEIGDDPLLAGYGSHNVRWAYDEPANDRDEAVAGGTNVGRRANAMGSAHAGTFTVAYADGSVQEISTSIDLTVHRRLASRADGQTVERP